MFLFTRISAEELHALPVLLAAGSIMPGTSLACKQKREKEKLFILGAYGKKPSSGYEVEIKQITKGPEMLKVRVEFRTAAGPAGNTGYLRPFELWFIST